MPDEKKPEAAKIAEPEPELVKHELPKKPIIAPDGHVVLSQEDIDARQ